MHIDIKTALIGAIGGMSGGLFIAAANHYFGLEENRQEILREARREAYVDWLNVREVEEQSEWDLKGRQSINRIAVYGGQEVVNLVAEWYQTHLNLKFCEDEDKTFDAKKHQAAVNSFQAMRRDLIPEESVSDANMSILLTRCEWPKAR